MLQIPHEKFAFQASQKREREMPISQMRLLTVYVLHLYSLTFFSTEIRVEGEKRLFSKL